METPGGEVEPVTCSDNVTLSIADTCEWQEAERGDKFDALADLLLYGSTGVAFLGGWRFAR
ncbi:hypothetical protein [Demequina sp. NBRC 110055]|uniref:hypothetical protein n=1 Tax=Demequina sp. NBRC 110055 TaxID=1570344 RepID=UPI00118685EF|nr:hypothetical protein [Demequina sp. NBRC 110055]